MKEIFINTVQDFNDYYGFETLHPLVSVAQFDKERKLEEALYHYGLYALFLKENKGCQLSYGRTKYDFDEMTVTSFAPGKSSTWSPIPMSRFPNGQPCCSIPTYSKGLPWARKSADTSSSTTPPTKPSIFRAGRLRYSVACST